MMTSQATAVLCMAVGVAFMHAAVWYWRRQLIRARRDLDRAVSKHLPGFDCWVPGPDEHE